MELDSLLLMMVDKEASDLFITVGRPPSLKIEGRILPVSQTPLTPENTHGLVYGIMTDAQQKEFDATKECNFALSAKGIGRFRVSAFIQRNAVGMVLRRIKTVIPEIDALNLPPMIKDLAMIKRGLVIFAGPTGVGKSTSLAAMIGYRNQNSSGHIVTIEDPIEFIHNHAGCIVTQREVGLDTTSYEVALQNTLRQAPDVVLIGEIRSRETMEQALSFADTGHLCLSTIHANNADQTFERILNFFPEDRRSHLLMDLSLNLRAIVAQQLIRRKDHKERRAVVEILLNTPLMADMIRRGDLHRVKDVMKSSTENGMITFDQALVELYNQGEIAYEDALAYADSANEVRLSIKLATSGVDAFDEELEGASLVEDRGF